MRDEPLPPDFYRIRSLLGDLDAAVWKRIDASEDKVATVLMAVRDVYPKTSEETTAWEELTAPRNREGLLQWIAYWGSDIHDHAKRLYDALRTESDMRALTENRPHQGAYCVSSLVLLDGNYRVAVHPADVDAVRRVYVDGWQLVCFQYRGRDGDYDVLDAGEYRIRVRDVLVEPVPEPRFKLGQRVYAAREQRNGAVRQVVWNWKRKQPHYLLNFNDKRSGFWYHDSDLEPA